MKRNIVIMARAGPGRRVSLARASIVPRGEEGRIPAAGRRRPVPVIVESAKIGCG
jgi:hypothetical protein